ncbi:MAG: hypothetical protein EU542_06095, partial [Promethearchaeota archaeon]
MIQRLLRKQLIMRESKFSISIILLFLCSILFYSNYNFQNNSVTAHSNITQPREIFSLWNDSSPDIDGSIDFTANTLSGEWSSASVYQVLDEDELVAGKFLLMNDGSKLHIALDLIYFNDEDPGTPWGISVFLDLNHDARISSVDRKLSFTSDSSGDWIELFKGIQTGGEWTLIESETL